MSIKKVFNMSVTDEINKKLGLDDLYISLKMTNGEDTQIISNMPDSYKDIYYTNQYNKIDDTFYYTEANPSKICFPNALGEYHSDYIKKMESHGYYNLFSFSLTENDATLSCIVTVPWCPSNNELHLNELKETVVLSVSKIVREFSEHPAMSNFDFSVI